MKKPIDEIENKSKIKYNFNCKHYFGIICATNEEEAKPKNVKKVGS